MKLSFHSIIFKTLFSLLIFSVLFIGIVGMSTKESFSQAFKTLNLSYDLKDSIADIAQAQLANKKILLIQIKSPSLQKVLRFSNSSLSLKKLTKEHHFVGAFLSLGYFLYSL